jgi:hypothetical protein
MKLNNSSYSKDNGEGDLVNAYKQLSPQGKRYMIDAVRLGEANPKEMNELVSNFEHKKRDTTIDTHGLTLDDKTILRFKNGTQEISMGAKHLWSSLKRVASETSHEERVQADELLRQAFSPSQAKAPRLDGTLSRMLSADVGFKLSTKVLPQDLRGGIEPPITLTNEADEQVQNTQEQQIKLQKASVTNNEARYNDLRDEFPKQEIPDDSPVADANNSAWLQSEKNKKQRNKRQKRSRGMDL